MNRRAFMAGAGGGMLAALPAAASVSGVGGEGVIFATTITNIADVLGSGPVPVRSGEVLALARTPDRVYDRNSILVSTADGRGLGYIPTNQSKILARLMEAGVPMSARATEVRDRPRPLLRVELAIAPLTHRPNN